MQFTIDIPDELIPVVSGILSEKQFPDDDGATDAMLMTKYNLTGEQFVQAMHILDSFSNQIFQVAYDREKQGKRSSKLVIGGVDELDDLQQQVDADNERADALAEYLRRSGLPKDVGVEHGNSQVDPTVFIHDTLLHVQVSGGTYLLNESGAEGSITTLFVTNKPEKMLHAVKKAIGGG